jgi:DNA-binding response OmpR family regulator
MSDQARILVIEDEPGASMMMVHVLTQAGCEAMAAWSAEQGMRLAQTGKFDLFLLEVNLPGVSGFEVCRQLKENPRLSGTPVIFVSSQFYGEDVCHGLELGAVDYIKKPFDVWNFISRVLPCIKPASTSCGFDPSDVSDESADTDPKSLCNAT